jgi:hypothetical protein
MRGEMRIPSRYVMITVLSVFTSALLSATITNYTTRSALRATIAKENKLAKDSSTSLQDASAESILSMCSNLVQKMGNTAGKSDTEGSRRENENPAPAHLPPSTPCPPPPPPAEQGKAAVPASLQTSAAPPLIDFPEGIKNVIINIGTNYNPIMPPEDDQSTVVLAGNRFLHCLFLKICLAFAKETARTHRHLLKAALLEATLCFFLRRKNWMLP